MKLHCRETDFIFRAFFKVVRDLPVLSCAFFAV